MTGRQFRARNDAGFIVSGTTHRLRRIEFGVLERREASQSRDQGRGQFGPRNVNLIRVNNGHGGWQGTFDGGRRTTARRRRKPRLFLLLDERNARRHNFTSRARLMYESFDSLARNRFYHE